MQVFSVVLLTPRQMLCGPHQRVADSMAARWARRERVSLDHGYFMGLLVSRIMSNPIDARYLSLFARFCHSTSPFFWRLYASEIQPKVESNDDYHSANLTCYVVGTVWTLDDFVSERQVATSGYGFVNGLTRTQIELGHCQP